MKLFVAVLVLALAREGIADKFIEECRNCEYVDGIGYLPGENCRVYLQCVKRPDGSVYGVPQCCPNRTRWEQSHLNCLFGYCDAYYDCPNNTIITGVCPFEEIDGVDDKYLVKLTGDVMTCGDATLYSQKDCACVQGGVATCDPDPLMYFPFANHFNDIQCHKVQGTPHGDARLDYLGYMCLDGDGDFMSFGFLSNWFVWKDTTDLTISFWFNQTQGGWDHENNYPWEGLFGNGRCDQEPSIWMTMGNETQQGGVRTDSDQAVFENGGEDQRSRWYIEPDVWCQMAIRYTKTTVDVFLNGEKTGSRSITGTLENTVAQATFGMVYLNCTAYFWTGCLDDLLIFNRYVGDSEQDYLFGRGPTEERFETPYNY